jgi:hypothetical protein
MPIVDFDESIFVFVDDLVYLATILVARRATRDDNEDQNHSEALRPSGR